MTWIGIALVFFCVTILSRPTGLAFAFEVTGTVGTLTVETWLA
jgi:hypothetical protein